MSLASSFRKMGTPSILSVPDMIQPFVQQCLSKSEIKGTGRSVVQCHILSLASSISRISLLFMSFCDSRKNHYSVGSAVHLRTTAIPLGLFLNRLIFGAQIQGIHAFLEREMARITLFINFLIHNNIHSRSRIHVHILSTNRKIQRKSSKKSDQLQELHSQEILHQTWSSFFSGQRHNTITACASRAPYTCK